MRKGGSADGADGGKLDLAQTGDGQDGEPVEGSETDWTGAQTSERLTTAALPLLADTEMVKGPDPALLPSAVLPSQS